MCYSATHLEKLDLTRQQQWQKVARLTADDMACVTNLEYLGVRRAMGGGQYWSMAAYLSIMCIKLRRACLLWHRSRCGSAPRAVASALGASGGVLCARTASLTRMISSMR